LFAVVVAGIGGSLTIGAILRADEDIRMRQDALGQWVPEQSNAPQIWREAGASQPQRSAVGASLSQGEMRDGLGRAVPIQSNFPSTYAAADLPAGQSGGAAGYPEPTSADWHQPTAPFRITE